jgi:hypothetical protein
VETVNSVLVLRSLETGPEGQEALAIIPNPALVARFLEMLVDAATLGVEAATRPVVEDSRPAEVAHER